jgi:DNA-binding MarR family transcriptional regulator
MKLEEEIKQTRPLDNFQKALLNIRYTESWLSGIFHQTLKPYGISQQQYNVLRILRGQCPNPSPLQLITDRMVDKMSNATRLVEKLRKNGLVTRHVCEANRRKVDIMITEKGLGLLDKLDKVVKETTMKIKNLSQQEIDELNRILDKLRG